MELDFVCVGPQRTGTTWLDASLRRHPHVCLPEGIKETMYYDRRGFIGRERYERFFEHRRPGQVVGEVSPSYFHAPEAARRLHADAPNAKILVMLRDPTEKTFSLFLHHLKKGRVRADLRSAIETMPEILDSGRYAKYLPMWTERFGEDRTHLVFFEDIAARPVELLAEISGFLGVPAPDASEPIRERVYARASAPPRFPLLARGAAALAARMHDLGLHRVVEAGKRLGLRRVYGGSDAAMPELSDADRAFLDEALAEDRAYLEHLSRERRSHSGT